MIRALVVLAACHGHPDAASLSGIPDPDGLLTRHEVHTRSEAGVAAIEVQVEPGEVALLLTASADSRIAVDAVVAPDGSRVVVWQDWVGDEALSDAFYPEFHDAYFSWPVRADDPPLTPGRWTLELATVTSKVEPIAADVDAVVLTRRDDDPERGTLYVRLGYADRIVDDPALVAAIEAAVERWKELYDDFGLTVQVVFAGELDLSRSIEDPSEGDLGAVTAASHDWEITVVIAEKVGRNGDLGLTGRVPCTTLPNPRAAVGVSWLAHAGADRSLDDDEVRLLGETLAHEVAHHLGVYHPVESGWELWDALDDTARCTSEVGCTESLGTNLMFPFPVCLDGGCAPQIELTDGQRATLHRYGATL